MLSSEPDGEKFHSENGSHGDGDYELVDWEGPDDPTNP